MTVQELINELQKYDPNIRVMKEYDSMYEEVSDITETFDEEWYRDENDRPSYRPNGKRILVVW